MISAHRLPRVRWTAVRFRRYLRVISLQRLPAPTPTERNGAITTTEVEVPAARGAMAMEMVTDMAMGIATGTVMGMVMDEVTETAMAMAMEMVTEMAMCLVVEEVEMEEVPQPVVAEVVVVELEVVVEAEAAVLEEVAVAAVVVDMIFA